MAYRIQIQGEQFEVEVGEIEAGRAQVAVNGQSYEVLVENLAAPAPVQALPRPVADAAPPPAATPKPRPAAASAGTVIAPIPGMVMQIKVAVGERVQAGQSVAVIEAMKMENNLITNFSGTVREIHVQKGAQVNTGDPLLTIG